jgi:hypothetical protein
MSRSTRYAFPIFDRPSRVAGVRAQQSCQRDPPVRESSNHFMEVETPMLHPDPGGANAATKHAPLRAWIRDALRIAPELYF